MYNSFGLIAAVCRLFIAVIKLRVLVWAVQVPPPMPMLAGDKLEYICSLYIPIGLANSLLYVLFIIYSSNL